MKLSQPNDNTGRYNTVLGSDNKPRKVSIWREALVNEVFRDRSRAILKDEERKKSEEDNQNTED